MEHDAERLARAILGLPPAANHPKGNAPAIRLAAPRRLSAPGRPLPDAVRGFFERRLHVDLGAVRLHTDAAAAAAADAVGARGFALGPDLVFGRGEFGPDTASGLRLLAHELAHVLQYGLRTSALQSNEGANAIPAALRMRTRPDTGRPVLRRKPQDEIALEEEEDTGETDAEAPAAVPDDEALEPGIDWLEAEGKNLEWWRALLLEEIVPIRDIDPIMQPHAYANRTARAQALLIEHGPEAIAGGRIEKDGIFGPRTVLALEQVARDEKHAARAAIQGLGFDLDAIGAAEQSISRARAFAIKPEFLVQAGLDVLGENAVRYYDQHFHRLVTHDRIVIDQLLFPDGTPDGIRREDRIELLRRLYSASGVRLKGTAALARVKRDFIHGLIDFERAVDRDTRRGVERHTWFSFGAQDWPAVERLQAAFGVQDALQKVYTDLPKDEALAADEAVTLLREQVSGPLPTHRTELAAILVAIYLPTPDEERRSTAVSAYLVEKEERERAEREAIETHNRDVARQWADQLVALIDGTQVNDEGDELNNLERLGYYLTYLADYLRQKEFFDLVLDDLKGRPGTYFTRLYDEVEGLRNNKALAYLTELSLAGRYRNDPRVRRAVAKLGERVGDLLKHSYVVDGEGAVLLGGDDRLEVGEVAGAINSAYLRDENREQLKPEAQARLTAEMDNQGRLYVERLLRGEEPERLQADAVHEIVKLAWVAAGIDADKDIEDVEFQESVRLLGVRRGETGDDGITRYQVQFDVVQRIVGDNWDTGWQPVKDCGAWRSEHEFEERLFWYKFSQTEDIIRTMAIVVAVAATIVVAWEVGLIAALVAAGGGAAPVSIAILLSLALYHFTHERHTIEGYLGAAVTGYLGAVGFKLFAPAGVAAGRLILPATLEQVAFRRVVAAWITRHAVTGGLTGVTVGPAGLFVEDLLRIAVEGGGFSPLEAYVTRAAVGLVFGAVFEVAGAAILSPIFKVADRTVLSKLADVIKLIRQENPHITMRDWLAESAVSLSKFRQWLDVTMEPAKAKAVYEAAKKRFVEGTAKIWTGAQEGFTATLQREVLELGGATLSDDAVKGLERLLRLSKGTLDNDAVATLLQQVRVKPERVQPWLKFLADAEETTVSGLVTSKQLRALADAESALALSVRRSVKEVDALLGSRFDKSVADLDAFATRLNKLDDALADRALDLLRTRGTAVTPRTLLRMAETGAGLDDELLAGLQRLLDKADAARLDDVLDHVADAQVGPYLQRARTAAADDYDALIRTIADIEAPSVGWSATLAPKEAEALLRSLDPIARGAILDIPPEVAKDVVAALTPARVNRALVAGAKEGFSGAHLRALHEHLDPAAAANVLDTAAGVVGRLRTVRDTAAKLAAGSAKAPVGGDLTARSVILDSNSIFPIEHLLQGRRYADMSPNDKAAIDALRTVLGLGKYVDPTTGAPTLQDIVGAGADLRLNLVSSAEVLRGELATGVDILASFKRVAVPSAHPDYEKVIKALAAPKVEVGGPKSAFDRIVVADALLADAPGVTPTLITTDDGIVVPLARHFAVGKKFVPAKGAIGTAGDVASQLGADHFTVDILGHKLIVRFGGS